MAIIEIPFSYNLIGYRPKARHREAVRVVDRMPVDIRDVSDGAAPVVVRVEWPLFMNAGTFEFGACRTHVESQHHLASMDRVDIRAMDGVLWRPVWAKCTVEGQFKEFAPIGRDCTWLEHGWIEDSLKAFRSSMSVPDELTPWRASRAYENRIRVRERPPACQADAIPFRRVVHDNRLEREQAARGHASEDFCFIGDVLHVRTPGAYWCSTPRLRLAHTACDGILSSRDDDATIFDAWDRESVGRTIDGDVIERGSVEFVDLAAYAAAAIPARTICLAYAAAKVADFSGISVLQALPAEAAAAWVTLGRLPDAEHPDFDAGEAERLLRTFDAAFPLTPCGSYDLFDSPVARSLALVDVPRNNRPALADDAPRP